MALSIGATLLAISATADAGVRPKGAVKLKASQLKKVGSLECGRVRGAWLSGTKLRGGYFITHAQQAKNFKYLARRSKGKARQLATRKATKYLKKAKAADEKCKPVAQQKLRFAISKASALIVGSKSSRKSSRVSKKISVNARASSPTSNLTALLPSGQLRDAITNGSATVGLIAIGPDGNLYVAFTVPGARVGETERCYIAQVTRTTGEAKCIDPNIMAIAGADQLNESQKPAGGWIQFDALGGVYYSGLAGQAGSRPSRSTQVLRRWSNGTVTDLIASPDISITDAQVLPDSTVLVSGITRTTNQNWTRRVNASGGIQTLRNAYGRSLGVFPDGNVYWGMQFSPGNSGVHRYVVSAGQFEERRWIGGPADGSSLAPYFDASVICPWSDSLCSEFTGSYGSNARAVTTRDRKVFAVSGGLLFTYYPTVSRRSSLLRQITLAEAVGNDLLLAGLDSQGRNVLVRHSANTGQETLLIGSSNETEIFHMTYSTTSKQVVFDGLRFADNKLIVGTIDVSSWSVSAGVPLTEKPASVSGI